MKSPFPHSASAALFCGLAFLTHQPAGAEDFVAVSSKVSHGYVRTVLADGTVEPESYVFKEGGYLSGRIADPTIDRMTFADVSKTLAGPLSLRKYTAAVDPKAAKLLIVVYWGTTRAPAETSSATTVGQQEEREVPPSQLHQNGFVPFRAGATAPEAQAFSDKMIDEEDAMMLGYGSAADPDLRNYRYFVVLLAYDCQSLLRDKKETLLWETRFSMNEHRNQFDAQLKPMVLAASAYFGRDSLGLVRDPVPEGHVEIGDVKSLGALPDPNTTAALAPDGAHVAYITDGEDGRELAVADIDRPGFHSAGQLPKSSGGPMQLAWIDAERIIVRLPSSELLAFNNQGKRIDFDPRSIDPSFAGFFRAAPDNPSVRQVQALVEGKLPDRKVVVLGADKTLRRFLLIASDSATGRRIFVYDRTDELLYEIGRSVSVR